MIYSTELQMCQVGKPRGISRVHDAEWMLPYSYQPSLRYDVCVHDSLDPSTYEKVM